MFGKFLLTWPACLLVTALFLFLFLRFRPKEDSGVNEPPQTLSPEQFAFVCSYQAYKELKMYFVSHIEQHIEAARLAFNRLIPYESLESNDRETLVRYEALGPRSRRDGSAQAVYYLVNDESSWFEANLRRGFSRQVQTARTFLKTFEKFAWFKPDTTTREILQALISLEEKIPPRLVSREDLPAAVTILENFSKFLYAYLPEHQAYMEPNGLADLQADGSACLSRFVRDVNALTSSHTSDTPKKSNEVAKPTLGEKFETFYSYSVFFRFTIWFVLILILNIRRRADDKSVRETEC